MSNPSDASQETVRAVIAQMRETAARGKGQLHIDCVVDYSTVQKLADELEAALVGPSKQEAALRAALEFVNGAPLNDYAHNHVYEWRKDVSAQIETALPAPPQESKPSNAE